MPTPEGMPDNLVGMESISPCPHNLQRYSIVAWDHDTNQYRPILLWQTERHNTSDPGSMMYPATPIACNELLKLLDFWLDNVSHFMKQNMIRKMNN